MLHGLRAAQEAGFTHALTMDSDGQHPADLIPAFMQASQARPETMVLGRPVFDASAPLLRVRGRRVSNGWTQLETLFAGVGDSLYGFRVYPVADLIAVMARQPWMRRFDFDTEAVVRLAWRGVKPVNIDAPVKYLTAEEGGVSHFRYVRDNLLLTWMHARLMVEFVLRLPGLLLRKMRGRRRFRRDSWLAGRARGRRASTAAPALQAPGLVTAVRRFNVASLPPSAVRRLDRRTASSAARRTPDAPLNG